VSDAAPARTAAVRANAAILVAMWALSVCSVSATWACG